MTDDGQTSMTISGKKVTLTRQRVIDACASATPETVQTHGVLIEHRLFPVKQALALATGMDVLDFNTNQARRMLMNLDFEVRRLT